MSPRKPKPHHKRVTTTRKWIEEGPLVPWMYLYLQWLAGEPTGVLSAKGVARGYQGAAGVTLRMKVAKASFFAKRMISDDAVRSLEQRLDSAAYFDKLRADIVFQAREAMSARMMTNIEARDEGLHRARGYVQVEVEKEVEGEKVKVMEEQYCPAAVDTTEIRQYTNWTIEAAFPKKVVGEKDAQRIVIVIGSQQAREQIERALSEPDEVQDVEYEVIEQKQLEPGDEE